MDPRSLIRTVGFRASAQDDPEHSHASGAHLVLGDTVGDFARCRSAIKRFILGGQAVLVNVLSTSALTVSGQSQAFDKRRVGREPAEIGNFVRHSKSPKEEPRVVWDAGMVRFPASIKSSSSANP